MIPPASEPDVTASSTRANLAVRAVGVALLFAPLAVLVVAGPGSPRENRPAAPFPGTDAGWSWAADAAAATSDRIPLRAAAISLDGWIDEHVFGEDRAFGGSALPQVLRGADGTLFYADDFRNACSGAFEVDEAIAAYRRFAAAVESSGRSIVSLIAPDKSSVLTAAAPADHPLAPCRAAYSDRLWDAANAAGLDGWTDLRAILRDLAAQGPQPAYYQLDSHWAPSGGLAVARIIVDAVQPGMFSEGDVIDLGIGERRGDLTSLIGAPSSEPAQRYEIRRPGVERVREPNPDDAADRSSPDEYRYESTSASLIGGTTLFLIDSFGELTAPFFLPYFEQSTVANLRYTDAADLAALIERHDRVVVMSVERHFPQRSTALFGSQSLIDAIDIMDPR